MVKEGWRGGAGGMTTSREKQNEAKTVHVLRYAVRASQAGNGVCAERAFTSAERTPPKLECASLQYAPELTFLIAIFQSKLWTLEMM